jgi:hypothetical protein
MIDKISKCVVVFSVGVTLSLASMAFFQSFMQMPQQMMMGSMQMMNQDKPCDCNCKKLN